MKRFLRCSAVAAACLLITAGVLAQSKQASTAAELQKTPKAVFTDAPADAAHPAKSTVLHIPSHGVEINGLVYQPSGAGPHPTLVLCHGWPGNEKNLDLAQAVRRAGWNVVTFNYRGSWGSPGSFSFAQNLEDADAVLAYLRSPANAAALGVDTHRMVLAGHSMGGWVTAQTAAHDHALAGAILISAADMGRLGFAPPQIRLQQAQENSETLAATAQQMSDELQSHARQFLFANDAEGLSHLPLLALTADDGLAPDTDALVQAIKAKGGQQVTEIHVATDHSWSDHRITLESIVINWLAQLP